MRGYQCKKALFLSFRHPELESKPDEALRNIFEQGFEVGRYAQKEFPQGVHVNAKAWEFEEGLKITQKLLHNLSPVIFEGFFSLGNLFCRADILVKNETGLHLIEVKSSTKVKEENLQDLAIQTHIIEGSGLKLKSISLQFLNPECRYPDLTQLFKKMDVTESVRELAQKIPSQIEDFRDIFRTPSLAEIDIGKHCDEPNECVFKKHCWKKVPQNSVLELYRGTGWKYWELGTSKISDLHPEELEGINLRIFEAVKEGKVFFNSPAIKQELNSWKFPHHHLDFETLAPAIPRFHGKGPYQKVPFQYSLHVDTGQARAEEVTHFEYLHESASDPRLEIAKRLCEEIGDEGSVIAYNMKFEGEVLQDLADFLPQYSIKLLSIKERLKDPLPLLREHYYHPALHGSFSIKAVAPAILGESADYSKLKIPSGDLAPIRFDEMLNTKIPKKKNEIRDALLEYCAQDTFLMLKIIRYLANQG